jgi:hypothetical protein
MEPPGAAQHPKDMRADRPSRQTEYQDKRGDADAARHGFRSRFAPFWVCIAYLVSGLRDRASEISFMAAIVVTTVAVLILYAL